MLTVCSNRETSSSTNRNCFARREIRAKDGALKSASVRHAGLHFIYRDIVGKGDWVRNRQTSKGQTIFSKVKMTLFNYMASKAGYT